MLTVKTAAQGSYGRTGHSSSTQKTPTQISSKQKCFRGSTGEVFLAHFPDIQRYDITPTKTWEQIQLSYLTMIRELEHSLPAIYGPLSSSPSRKPFDFLLRFSVYKGA